MSNVITVGRRLIPRAHIAFVEPYEAGGNPNFQTTREYRGRLVTVNRDSVLTEMNPEAFAKVHGFRMLTADAVAANPAVHFQVESFEATEGFAPSKPYAARILWRDLDGNEQSKLLLSAPETVLAIVVQGEAEAEPAQAESAPARTRQGKPKASSKLAASPS